MPVRPVERAVDAADHQPGALLVGSGEHQDVGPAPGARYQAGEQEYGDVGEPVVFYKVPVLTQKSLHILPPLSYTPRSAASCRNVRSNGRNRT